MVDSSLDDNGNYPVFTHHRGNIFLEKTNTPQYIWDMDILVYAIH
tara:strand:+ start:859 stop:993 length:135 start_codon:yes stop_codon:yes gene_type:complete